MGKKCYVSAAAQCMSHTRVRIVVRSTMFQRGLAPGATKLAEEMFLKVVKGIQG